MIGQSALILLAALSAQPARAPADPPAMVASGATDLDQFMARVLERRDDNWRKLQQYVLDEREQAALLGPGGVRLYGLARDYTWYIRDGVFVRSPVRVNGVTLGEDKRRKYEDEWLAREKARDDKAAGRDAQPVADAPRAAADVDALVRIAREPRFVSAAYFLKFRFEPGRYAFAGPDTYDGRRVLRIEYYPAQLYTSGDSDRSGGDRSRPDEEREMEDRLNRQFNKVALITLWVEPGSHQIVKYVFENIGMDFLPGRSLVRVDDVRAEMEMGQPFAGVWLPRHIEGHGAVTLANGTYRLQYGVDYRDYREATTRATIR